MARKKHHDFDHHHLWIAAVVVLLIGIALVVTGISPTGLVVDDGFGTDEIVDNTTEEVEDNVTSTVNVTSEENDTIVLNQTIIETNVTVIANDTVVNETNVTSATDNSTINTTETTDTLNTSVSPVAFTVDGTADSLSTSGVSDIAVTINGAALNDSFTGLGTVEIKDDDTVLFSFDYTFSNNDALNLSLISVDKDDNSLVVNTSGQVSDKSLFVASADLATLCVVDAELGSADEVSVNCSGTNELDFTSCIGNSSSMAIGGVTCSDDGATITLAGLSHSVVTWSVVEDTDSDSGDDDSSESTATEEAAETFVSSCKSTWSCTDWTECSESKQTRVCSDAAGCTTPTDKPAEEQSCDSAPAVVPDATPLCTEAWSCGNWSLCELGANQTVNGTQTRECADANTCGTVDSKPSQMRSCVPESTGLGSTLWWIIGIIAVAIIAMVIIVLHRKK